MIIILVRENLTYCCCVREGHLKRRVFLHRTGQDNASNFFQFLCLYPYKQFFLALVKERSGLKGSAGKKKKQGTHVSLLLILHFNSNPEKKLKGNNSMRKPVVLEEKCWVLKFFIRFIFLISSYLRIVSRVSTIACFQYLEAGLNQASAIFRISLPSGLLSLI